MNLTTKEKSNEPNYKERLNELNYRDKSIDEFNHKGKIHK